MSSLSGKVAVVTGGSRGIGRAVVERLARDGAKVVVNYARSADKAQAVVAAVKAAGGEATAVQADVTDLAQMRRLFDDAETAYGRIEILVLNAGIDLDAPFAEVTEALYDQVFSYARSNFFALQLAATRVADGGRILCLSSGATRSPKPDFVAYGASKAATEQFARAASLAVAKRGVTVNVVMPGFTDTDMLNAHGPGLVEWGRKMSPMDRIGTPADVADVIAMLAGDDARWVSGEIIGAMGGIGL